MLRGKRSSFASVRTGPAFSDFFLFCMRCYMESERVAKNSARAKKAETNSVGAQIFHKTLTMYRSKKWSTRTVCNLQVSSPTVYSWFRIFFVISCWFAPQRGLHFRHATSDSCLENPITRSHQNVLSTWRTEMCTGTNSARRILCFAGCFVPSFPPS